MIRTITPNRAVVFAVAAFVLYWIAALFIPSLVLRDVFNSLAFGTAIIITFYMVAFCGPSDQEGADSGEWQLILAIFLVWFVVLLQRIYVITFNWMGRPESWAEAPIAGFWPYSYTLAGLLFLSAPGLTGEKIGSRAVWSIVLAVAIGSLIAGILIGASISTVG